jgi:hypothetical protein
MKLNWNQLKKLKKSIKTKVCYRSSEKKRGKKDQPIRKENTALNDSMLMYYATKMMNEE